MAESAKKFSKNPENPCGAGILRLRVLDLLLQASRPLSIRDIRADLRRRKVPYSNRGVYRVISEISSCMECFELRSINTKTGYGVAKAFTIHIIKQNSDEL